MYSNIIYEMGLLDQISSSIDDMQRRWFNTLFGGGCPICKGDNTLDRKRVQGEMYAVCEQCGAVFKSVIPHGIKLIEGDERYIDMTFPINVWRTVRFLPEDDHILATCSDNLVNFYATTIGIVRESKGRNFLSYDDIFDISLVRVWCPNILHIIGFLLFLFGGTLIAIMMGPSLLVQGGVILPLTILGIGSVFLIMGRRRVYQIESPVLSKKERKDWRLKKTDSEAVRNFVDVVREQLEI